jgi:hypothetical protein
LGHRSQNSDGFYSENRIGFCGALAGWVSSKQSNFWANHIAYLHERGTDIKLIQELLSHNDLNTTLRYTHVSNRTLENIISPFDQLNLKKE